MSQPTADVPQNAAFSSATIKATTKIKGISIPIAFSTNKLSRKTPNRPARPVSGYMEVYFAPNPINFDEIDLLEPGKKNSKSESLYRTHHVYGDHRFLIPAIKEPIEKYEAPWNIQFGFGRIGHDPTTATYREKLQFIPCSASNLRLFQEKIQTEPFYLEMASKSFVLHIRNKSGRDVSVPSQGYSPRCWHGFAHPVVTLTTEAGSEPYYEFSQIPWSQIADEI